MFRIKGFMHGRAVEVAWDVGELSGSPVAVERIKAQARWLEGEAVGPECGPYTTSNHLADPLSALHAMLRLFEPGAEVSGDVPEPPELDEPDAIP